MAGVPLLPGILPAAARVIVEIPWGADLNNDASNWPSLTPWVDITTDVLQDIGPVHISPMGRSDRFAQAQPAGLTFSLDNTAGKYSKGPQSPNWPFVRPNTPVRVSVTVNGISIFTRFFGYVESWEPHDDETGDVAWVNVQAWGKMHTLDLRNQPITNTNVITRFHTRGGAAAVWPFDDPKGSTVAANAVPGGKPMVPTAPGAVFFGKDVSGSSFFGVPADGNFPAVGVVANIANPSFVGQDMATATGLNIPISGELHIDMWRWLAPEPDASETQLLKIDLQDPSGFFTPIELRARMSQTSPPVVPGWIVRVPGVGAVMDSAHDGIQRGNPFDNAFHNIHIVFQQVGSNVTSELDIDGTQVDSHIFTGKTLPSLLTGVRIAQSTVVGAGIGGPDNQSVLAINTHPLTVPSWTVGSTIYNGEAVTDRLARLCDEEGSGLPIVITGTNTTPMGPQKANTLVNLLRECEALGGVLFDGVSQGLQFVTNSAKYSQNPALVLDASTGQIMPPFEPKDQDPQRRNLFVVGRRNGTSVTVTDKTGPLGTDAIGTLPGQANDLNLADDSPLPNIGGWLLHLGTVNEPYQYPKLSLDLAAIPAKVSDWLSTSIGDRIDITKLSTVNSRNPLGTVSLILEGYSEVIAPYEWTVTANCSPYAPWIADTLGGLFRLEMVGQTLAAGLAPGATTLSLATAPGNQLFTTSAAFPADFPMDLNVGGWPVHVTATATSLTDAFGRTVSNGWGNADTGQPWTTSGGSASDYSVGSGVGKHTLSSVNVLRMSQISVGASDVYATVQVSLAITSTSGAPVTQWLCLRSADANNYYAARLDLNVATLNLGLYKRVGGVLTGALGPGTVTVGTGHVGGDVWNISLWISGSTLQAKAWLSTRPEPAWQIVTTDPDLTSGGNLLLLSRAETGNTNTAPVVSWDNLTVWSPQTLTVDPTPNLTTVPAGTSVSLWQPAALAL